MADASFPRLQLVGDAGVLVEFGDRIEDALLQRVRALDAALRAEPMAGIGESIPAYASLLIVYDPLVADPGSVRDHVARLLDRPPPPSVMSAVHEISVCYDPPFAPDLPAVALATGLSIEQVIAAHLEGSYRLYMYGFAPGYGYLGGVPDAIQLPRKPAPIPGVPSGSVIIAGGQCLVTTATMPTGWWVIGRSPDPIFAPDRDPAFLLDVGDRVRFRRIDAETLEGQLGGAEPRRL